jgi:hypothetical protein
MDVVWIGTPNKAKGCDGLRRYQPTWKLIKDTPNPNFYTIGVEHVGKADTPWSDATRLWRECARSRWTPRATTS